MILLSILGIYSKDYISHADQQGVHPALAPALNGGDCPLLKREKDYGLNSRYQTRKAVLQLTTVAFKISYSKAIQSFNHNDKKNDDHLKYS